MSLTATELLRIAAIESKLNDLQTAANNLATRKELKNLLAILTRQIVDVENLIAQIEATSLSASLAAHQIDPNAHAQLNDRYWAKSFFRSSSTGVADAGFPVKLGSDGLLDSSLLGDVGVSDHGELTGLSDDDHTQYFNVNGARTISGNLIVDNRFEVKQTTVNNLESTPTVVGYNSKLLVPPTSLATEVAGLYARLDHSNGQFVYGIYGEVDAAQSMVGGSFSKLIHKGLGDGHYVALMNPSGGFGYEAAMFKDSEEGFIATWQGNAGFPESVSDQSNAVGFQALLADDAVDPGFVPNYGLFYANNSTGHALTVRASAFANLGQAQIRITDTNFRNRLALYGSGQVDIYGAAATIGSQNETSSELHLVGSSWMSGAAVNRASIIKTVTVAQEPLEYHYYERTDGTAILGWIGKASGFDMNGGGLVTVSGIQMWGYGSGIDMQIMPITNGGNITLYSAAQTLNINTGSITTVGALQMYSLGTGLDMQQTPVYNVPVPTVSGHATNKGYVDGHLPIKRTISMTVDGAGATITTGGIYYVKCPFGGTITGWEVIATSQGEITFDVWRDNFTNFPPTITDSIIGSEPPILTQQTKNSNYTIASWNKTVNQGDWFAFTPTAVSGVQLSTVALLVDAVS